MVLISFWEFNRMKKNSDNFLLQKSRESVSLSDNTKGHGAMEIEEPSQLPNSEIPKQDIYQEKYGEAVLSDSSSNNTNEDIS